MFNTIIMRPIFNLLMVIYGCIPGGDFGLSVIIFTIIIRLVMWPLVKKQLNQARVMRIIQPEMARLRKKFGKDRQAMALATMNLYKKHNISMFGSIGVLLVQLPLLIGIWRVVQIFVTDRTQLAQYTYDIIENIPGVKSLIENPDNFNQNLFGIMDLTIPAFSKSGIVVGLVILAAIAAVLQFALSKQMSPVSSNRRLRDVMAEASQGKEADQAELNAIVMRKMMKFMPIMLFFIMIGLPGALGLYMATANIVAYAQNAIIIKQLDRDQPIDNVASSKEHTKKKSSAKKRASNATEARITRIKAKE